jgi:hypothetical protein
MTNNNIRKAIDRLKKKNSELKDRNLFLENSLTNYTYVVEENRILNEVIISGCFWFYILTLYLLFTYYVKPYFFT